MKRIFLGLGATLLLAIVIATIFIFIPLEQAPNSGLAQNIIIKDVNIVDVEAGQIVAHQDVIIQNGRLESIEMTSNKAHAKSLHVVEGRGKYLSPGLWDMHTHSTKVSPQFDHPLFIANGVLSVRDMSGCLSQDDSFWACIHDRKNWNQMTEAKTGLSPRYFLQSSYQTNGGNEVPGAFPSFFKVNEVGGIEQLVSFYQDAGADFIKTYSELSPEAYRALAKNAEARGLGLAGHRPVAVSLREAIAAKQQSIEHPRLFLFECYKDAAKFRALTDHRSAYNTEFKGKLVDGHDAKQCGALMQEMASSNSYWVPTLQVLQLGSRASDQSFREDSRLRYIPTLISSVFWQVDADQSAKGAITPKGRNVNDEIYTLAMNNLADAHDAGVKILVGTDAGDSYVFPGFSVHEEMAEFVKAGLSPQDALRMATIEAAKFSGVDDGFGSIKTGKAADMLLLTANPYDDIRNTQKIDGVFYSARFLDRSTLDELLDFAEEQAGSLHLNIHLLWDMLSSPLVRVQLED